MVHALFHYEDLVVVKSTYPRAPRGLGRAVNSKIIRPKQVTFSFESTPNTLTEQKKLLNWIKDCMQAIQLTPEGE